MKQIIIAMLLMQGVILNAADQQQALVRIEQALLQKCKQEVPDGHSFLALAKNRAGLYFALYPADHVPYLTLRYGNQSQLQDLKADITVRSLVQQLGMLSARAKLSESDELQTHITFYADKQIKRLALTNTFVGSGAMMAKSSEIPADAWLEIIE